MKDPGESSVEKALKVADVRMLRPVVFHEKKSKRSIVVQPSEEFSVGQSKVGFFTPNNVSLFVSIADRELKLAIKIYDSLIKKNAKKKLITVNGRNLTRLYNYLEHIQSSIISIYTAIESLANVAIPVDFKLEKKNNKGVTEIWEKDSIERWYKTSDKVADLVPKILKVKSPKTLAFWQSFKELEDIRNDIIHQKTESRSNNEVDSSFIGRLLQPGIFNTVGAGFALIRYFCISDTSHGFFPLGFGEAKIQPIVVDNFEDALEPIPK